jgi:hypothetical protein
MPNGMSALPSKADAERLLGHVADVPISDVVSSFKYPVRECRNRDDEIEFGRSHEMSPGAS